MSLIKDALQRWLDGAAPPERRGSLTGPFLALQGHAQPVWSPRNIGAMAREGFMKNPVVYRSVRMIAEAAASVPIRLFDGADELESHPLLDLLARPNAAECAPDLFEAWYGSLLISGNAYMEGVTLDGQPRELHVLRADRMRIVPGEDGWPRAYEYHADGQTLRFEQEVDGIRPILHMRQYHPINDHYGMSPLEAAAMAIDIHNAASGWNKALLDNAAQPSGALVYSGGDGHLSEEQYERLKTELEATYAGARNAGRPMLLEGGLDWKTMSMSPRDMDFISAKNLAAREIALALGVPPMLLGIPGDNTYSNFQEANRSFWRQTVLPMVNRTLQALGGWLAPAYGEALVLRPALDRVEALSTERAALWERVENASFLTVNEKRAAIGYGPVEDGDTLADAG
ncbi:phage portal protein [Dichotomicrobium thermohalophilum]|uniref:HK97 family phage portal protein n=1 Tax=Dichotomicrobium thermohalophilum TaxID=933063 RepID=A0A397Q5L0_9HYPH|nr:phage portal protein [Dichotomicrobium thermohalophilum]RIA56770.1 HK97 family phage portal protein [Dichotomicrobium thermohalophilum]